MTLDAVITTFPDIHRHITQAKYVMYMSTKDLTVRMKFPNYSFTKVKFNNKM